eukprot:SAG31_NODE_1110_length_9858_cov_41.473922_3_plen_166_part_00
MYKIHRGKSSGNDAIGDWVGTTTAFGRADAVGSRESGRADAVVEQTLKHYEGVPNAAVLTMRFLKPIDTRGCGKTASDRYTNPDNSVCADALALNTSFNAGPQLQIMSWGHHLDVKVSGQGLGKRAATCSTDRSPGRQSYADLCTVARQPLMSNSSTSCAPTCFP